MNTQEPRDVLQQVLEIVDLFEDENMRMAADILDRLSQEDRHSVMKGKIPESGLSGELLVVVSSVDIHAARTRTARNIGDAIRAKFGLPAKEEKQ